MLKLNRTLLSAAIGIVFHAALSAQAADFPGLPATEQVLSALENQPRVREAHAMLDVARARSLGIKAGSHEWKLSAGLNNRRVNATPNERYTEWEGALEKSFRLPGKATLDGELGEAVIQQAELAVGDALHESARELLKTWFDYGRAHEIAKLWQAQAGLFKQQADIVEKRIRAGDAPKLEREAARAALSQSQSQAARAKLQQEAALSLLKSRYPGLELARLAWADPAKPEGALDNWREAVLSENHELEYARASTRLAKLNGERLSANLRPDPTVGVRFASEGGGSEKLVGAFVSVPFPGAARRAEHNVALGESRAALTREEGIMTRLLQETESQYLTALRAHEIWQNASESADAYQKQADGAMRAYQLGEGSLSESLTARRLVLEAQLNEVNARVDSLEASYRLKLDAHQLWPFHQD